MYWLAAAALLNGVLICLSVVFNGRLQAKIGPFKASFANHLIGCAVLAVFLLASKEGFSFFCRLNIVPVQFFLGGVISAGFVALYSVIAPRIGILRTILLIISGQMLTVGALDARKGLLKMQTIGMLLILVGVGALYSREGSTSKKDAQLL